jgi:hypothetical protein
MSTRGRTRERPGEEDMAAVACRSAKATEIVRRRAEREKAVDIRSWFSGIRERAGRVIYRRRSGAEELAPGGIGLQRLFMCCLRSCVRILRPGAALLTGGQLPKVPIYSVPANHK